MKDCAHYRRLIERYVAGDLPQAELSELRAHASSCNDCGEMLTLHGELLKAGEEIPEPDGFDLQDMRDEVLAKIAGDETISPRPPFRAQLAALFRTNPLPAAFLLLLLLTGAFYTGEQLSHGRGFDEASMLRAIEAQAARGDGLDAYWDTPYSFSNVNARRQPDGKLALSFDVARHFDLVAQPDSPVARGALLHAVLDRGSMGSRMRAMTLSQASGDERLQEALVLAMHNDPDAAIRLKALAVLEQYPYSPAIQEALLKTLEADPSVQMRLLALDLLAGRDADTDVLRRAIEASQLDSDGAVIQHANEIIREF